MLPFRGGIHIKDQNVPELWGADWTPLNLATIEAWFNVDSINVANGSPVTSWIDETKNHTASTPGAAPTLDTTGIGGRAAVKFVAASSQYFAANSLTGLFSGTDTPYTLSMIIKLASVAASTTPLSCGNSGNTGPKVWHYTNTTPNYFYERHDGTIAGTAVGGTPDTNAHLTTWLFSGTAMTLRVDGTEVISNDAADVGSIALDLGTIGALRRAALVQVFMDGHIGDIVICSSALGSSDIDKLESYLSSKYSI